MSVPATQTDIAPTTAAQILDAIASIRPALEASAPDSDRLGTLAPAAVDALARAGSFRLQLPVELGGVAADPIAQMEALEALSAADTASGWCAMIGATSIGILGAFLPDSGAAKVFAADPIPCAASSFMPAGQAVVSEGGYRVSGRWRFCSGVRHSEWIWLGAAIQRDDGDSPAPSGPPETLFVTVPVADVTIHDNWQVVGLRGSGSCDISIDDCFVPHDMTFQWDFVAPQPHRGGPLYRQGVLAFIAKEHIGFALGVARRALDELIRLATQTHGAYRPSPLRDREVIHAMVGKFELELAAARALAFARYDHLWARLQAGKSIDMATQVQLQALAGYITEVATDIATAAFRYGGAGALYTPNILERLLRDIQAASQHIFVSDVHYAEHGKHIMGLVDEG